MGKDKVFITGGRSVFACHNIIIIMMMMMMMMMINMMMMMVMMMMMIIIIIIAFRGAIQDCLQSSQCAANRLQHVRSSGPGAIMQHIERLSRATCRVTCHMVRRDSSTTKFDRV